MQFKVGDVVVHPVYGVGDIVKIEEKRLSGIGARIYYEITLPRSTIWIPVKAQAAVGLRLVTARSDLDQYRNLLKSPPVPLNNDHPQRRHLELARRLKQGSFQVMCEIVRDLTASGERKPLGPIDKATLQKAQERLYQEWAMAAGISIAEATKEISTLLQTTQKAALK
jgi:RNA polymerase-interacting CarD/CdnL/TRCF family regulator